MRRLARIKRDKKINDFMDNHPEYTLQDVADKFGFKSPQSIKNIRDREKVKNV